MVAGALSIDAAGAGQNTLTGIIADAEPNSAGNAGRVNVAAGDLSVVNHGTISADSFGSGNVGTVNVTVGTLQLANFGAITADAFGSGTVSSGTLSIGPDGQITTDTAGTGGGGNIVINVAGALAIDGVSATGPTTGISALTIGGTGNAGNIKVTAGSLSIGPNGEITTDTFGTGKGGNISVTVAGALSIDGTSSTLPTGVTALTGDGSTGNAGNITVTALAKAEQSKDQALVAASSGALGNLAFVSRRTAGRRAAAEARATSPADCATRRFSLRATTTSATSRLRQVVRQTPRPLTPRR
jgi:hypothetical protein